MVMPGEGTRISHYRLVRAIGRGGMGEVFEAMDLRSDTPVAVKLLRPELSHDPTFRRRFEQEAHLAALLRSPYTAHLLDYLVEEDRCVLVMDFVRGETLADRLKGGRLDAETAVTIATGVARALEEAHRHTVVHRDIKPQNIMLTPDGGVRVLDFGIAQQAGGFTVTDAGSFVGSIPYMSPEQAEREADHRSDLYSLGVVLYHMLTGREPFVGSIAEVLQQHRFTAPPPEPLTGVDPALRAVVLRCLAKDPSERYQTASELAVALHDAAAAARTAAALAETQREQAAAGPGLTELGETQVVGGDTEPPPTEVLTRGAGRASEARLRLSLSSGGWTRRARRTLTLENLTAAPLTVRLTAAPSGGAVLRMADTVDVGASGRHALPIQVRPRGRRWAGGIRSIPYAIEASAGDGGRASVSGAIREWPVWWLPGSGLLGVAVLVVALVLGLSSGGGGGVAAEEEVEQQQEEELVTAVRPPTRAELDAYVENLTAISESFDSRTAAAQTRLLQCEQESGDLAFFTCAAREWDTLGIEYGQTRGELMQLNVAPSLRADHEVLSQNFDAWIDAVLDARRIAQDCARRLTSGCSTDYEDARQGVLDAQGELLEGLSEPVVQALAPLFASG